MTEEIEAILKKFPGIQFEVTTFLGDRIGETVTGMIGSGCHGIAPPASHDQAIS